MHYIIIIAIIVIIVIIQIRSFLSTLKKIDIFKDVFPGKFISEEAQQIKNQFEQNIKQIDDSGEAWLVDLLVKYGIEVTAYYTNPKSSKGDIVSYGHYNRDDKIFDKRRLQEKLKELAVEEKNKAISDLNNSSLRAENPIFSTIKNSINNYVEANKGSVSDFYLIKDIVDRNCDAKEEEIQAQIPVPLYLGLVGTMAGILVVD
jgi:hypothetical protein